MNIKIAIPNNPIYMEITENAENIAEKSNMEIYRLPENQLGELFLSNRFDVALINPLIYGKGVIKGDYRVIKGPALFAEGYTETVSMYFNPKLSTIDKFTVTSKDEYLMIISRILLAERYGILGELDESKGTISDDLDKYDAAFAYGKPDNIRSMDLTEDWTDQFRISLPIAFWAVKNEEEPLGIVEAVHRFTRENLKPEKIIKEKPSKDEINYHRTGKLIYHWQDYLEKDIDETLELLFLHQQTPEMAAVKIIESQKTDNNNGEEKAK